MTNVVAISAGGGWQGYLHSVALRADGTLVAWGNNNYARQLMVPPDLVSATAISAGGGSTLAYLNDRSPAFTVQPWSRTVASGTNVTLRALTVGQPRMRYQWYANGQAFPGATNNTLTFTNTQPAQSGAYQLVAVERPRRRHQRRRHPHRHRAPRAAHAARPRPGRFPLLLHQPPRRALHRGIQGQPGRGHLD